MMKYELLPLSKIISIRIEFYNRFFSNFIDALRKCLYIINKKCEILQIGVDVFVRFC